MRRSVSSSITAPFMMQMGSVLASSVGAVSVRFVIAVGGGLLGEAPSAATAKPEQIAKATMSLMSRSPDPPLRPPAPQAASRNRVRGRVLPLPATSVAIPCPCRTAPRPNPFLACHYPSSVPSRYPANDLLSGIDYRDGREKGSGLEFLLSCLAHVIPTVSFPLLETVGEASPTSSYSLRRWSVPDRRLPRRWGRVKRRCRRDHPSSNETRLSSASCAAAMASRERSVNSNADTESAAAATGA